MKQADVIIITYNRIEMLRYILSVLSEQSEKNFGVIVIDDGSKQLIDPNKYPIITKYIWATDDGVNRVVRMNEAYKIATAENIISLDDDCIPLNKDFIKSHLELLATHDAVFGPTLIEEPTTKEWLPWEFGAGGHNLGIKRKALEQIGYMDEAYNNNYGSEDVDFKVKMVLSGLKIARPKHSQIEVKHLSPPRGSDGLVNSALFMEKWRINPWFPAVVDVMLDLLLKGWKIEKTQAISPGFRASISTLTHPDFDCVLSIGVDVLNIYYIATKGSCTFYETHSWAWIPSHYDVSMRCIEKVNSGVHKQPDEVLTYFLDFLKAGVVY